MKSTTWTPTYEYIRETQPATVTGIAEHTGLSRVRVHSILNYLLSTDRIYKVGSTPKVFYYTVGGVELDVKNEGGVCALTLRNNGKVMTAISKPMRTGLRENVSPMQRKTLIKSVEDEVRAAYIEPGITIKPNHLFGIFVRRYIQGDSEICRSFDAYMYDTFDHDTLAGSPEKRSDRMYAVYMTIMQHTINSAGWLDATPKLHSLKGLYADCDESMHIHAMYYAGIDKIDAIKTVNYELMERIKEYQSLDDMELYCNQVFVSEFDQLVEHNAYDAFLIVPNNVTRLHSFNEYIASYLQTNYADYPLVAVSTLQFVGRKPQKKISGICKRIENASKLFVIDATSLDYTRKKILIIDDVIGSGATINTIAKKVKELNPILQCDAFALLGSYRKGFDVVVGI